MSNDEKLRSAALDYADNGWRVIPLHTIERGACSCGKASCADPGKHPRLTEWQHRASTDPDQIARWWRQWPNANVGIATGETSNLWVLDIDNKESVQVGLAIVGRGEQSLREMQQDHVVPNRDVPSWWSQLYGSNTPNDRKEPVASPQVVTIPARVHLVEVGDIGSDNPRYTTVKLKS